jgi:hypothetical protein
MKQIVIYAASTILLWILMIILFPLTLLLLIVGAFMLRRSEVHPRYRDEL